MSGEIKLTSGDKYTPKQASQIVGVSDSRIRQLCEEFEIEAERKGGANGHRRFTKGQVELLATIKGKYDEEWTTEQIKKWLKGKDAPVFNPHTPKSVDEMRLERVEAENRELREENHQIKDALKIMGKKMDEQTEFLVQMFQKQREEDRKQHEQLLEEKFNEHIGNRDQKFLTSVREIQQSHKEMAAYQEQMNKKPQTFLEKLAYLFGSSK
ncbi:MerR family transcriptional regulator [Priestia megaterium]|uniref:MerR family transcriptional regulator n=1 Tax=Priestia megaterium TaxID=1404 RepID=UPI0032D98779